MLAQMKNPLDAEQPWTWRCGWYLVCADSALVRRPPCLELPNWGGKRRGATTNLHITHDIIAKNRANIITAQEVDQPFIKLMKEPKRYQQMCY